MKNSSDKTEKPPAKKGPIRTGAVVPSLIIIVVVGVYFSFFFDGHLRRGLEFAGTHIYGAEVDIGHLRTSFIHANLEIENIQVTDKEHPELNIIQIGKIRFEMLWDALLRLKVVVDEASILDIQALAPRRHPGRVLPPDPPSHSPSALAKVQSEVLEQTRKQYSGNFLGDLAGLVGSGDGKTQLANLQGQLKSDAKIKQLQADLAEKKKQWDARIKALPQQKELQVYVDRIKALKFDFNNPSELAKNVGEAQKIVSEAQSKVKIIDQTQRDLKADIGNYSQQYKDLEKLVQEDLHDLQTKLKLPNIDAKEFSQQLFMSMIEKKLGGFAKYVELARQYMPAKKKGAPEEKKVAKEDMIIPPKRSSGTTYHFPITTGYPLFWLKHAAISSQVSSDEYSGNIKGEIRDLTTSPSQLGRPTVLSANGEFPKQKITGLETRITLDHTTEQAKESFDFKVAHFPVSEQKLSNSPDVSLALAEASGQSEMHGTFIDDELSLTTKNVFSNIRYDIKAQNKAVQDLIDSILKGIPQIDVNADIKGSLHALQIHINSNLGDALSKGFQKQLQAVIDHAKAELKKQIDDQINGPRQQLQSQISGFTGDLTSVDGKKAEADSTVKQVQSQSNGQKNGQQKQLEEQGKKLLKGLGF